MTRFILPAAIAALAISVLISYRTVLVPTSYGYIETDRWSGKSVACSVDEPGDTLQIARRADGKREILERAGFKKDEIDKYLATLPNRTCADLVDSR